MMFGSTIWSATTFWWLVLSRSAPVTPVGFLTVSSRSDAWLSTTDTVGITQAVSSSESKSIYHSISVIFHRRAGLSPGILDSFSAIFFSSSCDMLIYSYILHKYCYGFIIYAKFVKSSMTLKKNFKKYLSDSNLRKPLLYTSSKRVFICMVFLFFVLYFSIAANFYAEISTVLFSPIYLWTIVSLVLFFCMSILKFADTKLPLSVQYFLCLVCIVIWLSFLLPIL